MSRVTRAAKKTELQHSEVSGNGEVDGGSTQIPATTDHEEPPKRSRSTRVRKKNNATPSLEGEETEVHSPDTEQVPNTDAKPRQTRSTRKKNANVSSHSPTPSDDIMEPAPSEEESSFAAEQDPKRTRSAATKNNDDSSPSPSGGVDKAFAEENENVNTSLPQTTTKAQRKSKRGKKGKKDVAAEQAVVEHQENEEVNADHGGDTIDIVDMDEPIADAAEFVNPTTEPDGDVEAVTDETAAVVNDHNCVVDPAAAEAAVNAKVDALACEKAGALADGEAEPLTGTETVPEVEVTDVGGTIEANDVGADAAINVGEGIDVDESITTRGGAGSDEVNGIGADASVGAEESSNADEAIDACELVDGTTDECCNEAIHCNEISNAISDEEQPKSNSDVPPTEDPVNPDTASAASSQSSDSFKCDDVGSELQLIEEGMHNDTDQSVNKDSMDQQDRVLLNTNDQETNEQPQKQPSTPSRPQTPEQQTSSIMKVAKTPKFNPDIHGLDDGYVEIKVHTSPQKSAVHSSQQNETRKVVGTRVIVGTTKKSVEAKPKAEMARAKGKTVPPSSSTITVKKSSKPQDIKRTAPNTTARTSMLAPTSPNTGKRIVSAPSRPSRPSHGGSVSAPASRPVSRARSVALNFPPPPPRVKSTKPPTKPSFELPGEIFARKIAAQKEERRKRMEEEEKKRKEAKAISNLKSTVPRATTSKPTAKPRSDSEASKHPAEILIEKMVDNKSAEAPPKVEKRASDPLRKHGVTTAKTTSTATIRPPAKGEVDRKAQAEAVLKARREASERGRQTVKMWAEMQKQKEMRAKIAAAGNPPTVVS